MFPFVKFAEEDEAEEDPEAGNETGEVEDVGRREEKAP